MPFGRGVTDLGLSSKLYHIFLLPARSDLRLQTPTTLGHLGHFDHMHGRSPALLENLSLLPCLNQKTRTQEHEPTDFDTLQRGRCDSWSRFADKIPTELISKDNFPNGILRSCPDIFVIIWGFVWLQKFCVSVWAASSKHHHLGFSYDHDHH